MTALRTPTALLSLCLLLALGSAACGSRDDGTLLVDIRRWEDLRVYPAGDSLAELASGGSAAVRKAALRAMGRIGDSAARPALEARLAAEERPALRAEAAFALGILGDPTGAPALISRLHAEADVEALGQAALALGRLGAEGASASVVGLLGHDHPRVRELAIESLALLADSTSAGALEAAIDDPIESVAWRAAYALEKIPGQAQVPALVRAAADPRPEVSYRALRALGRLPARSPAAIEACVAGTRRGSWRHREKAVESLGRMGATGATAALATALGDSNFHVRDAAAAALGQLAAREALPQLIDRLEDPSVDVRASAYTAVGQCLDGRALPLLLGGLDDPSPYVRAAALRALGDCPEPAARDTLLARAAGDAHVERVAAVEGLGRLPAGLRPVDRLRELSWDGDLVVATVAVQGLAASGDSTLVPHFVELFAARRDGRYLTDLRLQLLEGLGELGDARAIPLLRAQLDDARDVRLRLAAREALAALLPPEEALRLPSIEELRRLVLPVERDPDQPARVVHSGATALVVTTPRGELTISLFGEDAPQFVENVARLAEEGFYDGLAFHRVVPDFVVQGGCPLGSGWGDAGYSVRSEWSPRRYERGTVGIAHSGKDTGCCQFFICHSPQPHLEARYTIIGEVVAGIEVVDRLQRGDTMQVEVVRAR